MSVRPVPRRWQVLSAICAGVFLAAIDFYIVSVAVPDLLRDFSHSGIAEISWVFNGYTITFTAALLPAGGLADRFGRRRIFLAGVAVFTLSALACATASHLGAPDVVRREHIVANSDYVGQEYGLPTQSMVEAVRLLAEQEGILLDPVYTGKGMAGLIDLVRAGRFEKDCDVVFLHTGGSFGLFGYPDAFGLPGYT